MKLEELPKWYENTYGKKWLRNNVAKERPISRESFTDEQWEKVLKFLERDFEFLKTVDVLLTTGER